MQRIGSRILFSPSDIGNFVACEYPTHVDLLVARGQLRRQASHRLILIPRESEFVHSRIRSSLTGTRISWLGKATSMSGPILPPCERPAMTLLRLGSRGITTSRRQRNGRRTRSVTAQRVTQELGSESTSGSSKELARLLCLEHGVALGLRRGRNKLCPYIGSCAATGPAE